MKPDHAPFPVRILEGQGASERAARALRDYYAELGERLGTSFGPDPLERLDPDDVTPPRGDFLLVSELGTAAVLGFGGVHISGRGGERPVAELQRMWLVPDARGRGLGRFLLRALENRARALGARRMRLSLHHTLTEAMALYESAGYEPVEEFATKPLVDVYLGKDL
jgi:GNAT superfamily N-acetyltransferase